MKKYKGRYVAHVFVDIEIKNPEQENIVSLQEIKDRMMDGVVEDELMKCLKEVFTEEFGAISVSRTYADIYEVDEE